MDIKLEDIKALIIKAETQIDEKKINENVILTDIGCDSLDMMNIFLQIQEKYDVQINDEDVEKLNTIKNIINFLKNK